MENVKLASEHFFKGLDALTRGSLAEAEESLLNALRLVPERPSVLTNLSIVYTRSGRLEDALLHARSAVAAGPNEPHAWLQQGAVLSKLQRHRQALESLDRSIALDPSVPEAHNNRGAILRELGQINDALASYDKAISLKPDHADAHNNRGAVLRELKRFDEALASCDRAIAQKPGFANALVNRGYVLRDMGRHDEAKASFEAATVIEPALASAWLGLADIDSESGNFTEAEAKYQKARLLEPNGVAALCRLTAIRKIAAGDPLINEIEDRLGDSNLPEEDLAQLHHAYAKICNDLGRYDEAIAQFSIGKGLLGAKFDMARLSAGFSAMKRVFTPGFFASRRGFGVPDERPVFVVGMPRSGTSLTEQILASHALVDGLGELPDLSRIANGLGRGLQDPEQFVNVVARLRAEDVNRMAARYLQAHDRARPGCSRIVDKMPHNFQWLGLVALMFPNAHIIHCRRDPLDTCVSIYMQNFIDKHDYAKDFTTLGRYFLACADLMRHWRTVLPVPLHECSYEELVRDPEATARALVSFLGLEWDPGCLDYHRKDHRVRTASRWQVRQPVYATSVERWRRYEKHLGPLKEALGLS